jgi:hypothetical protein
MTNAILAADNKAQYDEMAKRLLSHKLILSHILVKTVEEFRGMNPKNVVPYIEGEVQIGTVPVEPGVTNTGTEESKAKGDRIIGLNTEQSEAKEGMIRFDILFYVRTKDGLSKVIINIEIQKDKPMEYHLLNRGIFYACRLVSSQKEREFRGSDYDDIKKVFSIWIVMNEKENSMTHYCLYHRDLLGNQKWKGKEDTLNIVMLGLTEKVPPQEEKYELHRLLSALLSRTLTDKEKFTIMEQEYNIPIKTDFGKEVNVMCNLSEGIEEAGIRKGRAEGKNEIILNMHKKNYSSKEISEIVDMSEEEVKAIIYGQEPVLI